MWKAFHELQALGWLRESRFPRMVSVQSSGCAPIARAFDANERFATPWQNAHTCATGLRVPVAVGDFMILDAVRESGGAALAVDEDLIEPTTQRAISLEGMSFCPEAGACLLALSQLLSDGRVSPEDNVVIFNTGAASKYYPSAPPSLPRIADPHSVDFRWLEGMS
ncbi:MAG: pyridoxal-phosphate dependent enzyme, partial [Phycisphaerae bacterium]